MVVPKKNKKSMQKIPKGLALIAFVLVVTVAIYYREAAKLFRSMKPETVPAPVAVMDKPREVSAVVKYEISSEDRIAHEVRFTLLLDASGTIAEAKLVENPTNKASEKQLEFAANLTKVIRGKKLSELGPVDRIGTSSYTTEAFNRALDPLKSQL